MSQVLSPQLASFMSLKNVFLVYIISPDMKKEPVSHYLRLKEQDN